MKASLIKAAGLAVTLGFTVSAAHAEEPIEVKLSYNQPASSAAWQEVMQPYADRLEELSEGRLEVVTYPGEVLHPVADGFRAAATGITDVTSAWPVYQASSFKLFHGVQLPRALPDNDLAAVRVMDEVYAKYLRDEYERLRVKLAFNAVTPGYDIMTTTPVNSLEDLEGLRIRASGSTISDIVERLGATPVTMSITDAYTAFQQGVVDGIILATADMVAYRMHEVGKYNYRLGVARVAIPHAINAQFYDSLPEDLQNVFAEAGEQAGYDYSRMYMRLTERALEEMEKEGVTVVEASDEDVARVNELLEPMWSEFVENNGGEGSAAAELVKDLRAGFERYDDMSEEELTTLQDTQPVEDLR
ncbi:TRAP transporter substrate-binding protein [Tranquillimonas alkanivorans]|uniref:TRAP-type C4-dicarboxylate transport system, substrate-binding protein n=1 Tax=Tranquillimonas alkanivorans TaxID=441119 RepID=A0A1I5W9E6_9RHOB|nr:TRAP transporter substrate-binding protein DctP [Tranquillimonas alkanivorans]SFQ16343.1 TRAP-type C4-dicarboxylate transport system, substrate-binding protein [Tranquillimonas alkanivorans]